MPNNSSGSAFSSRKTALFNLAQSLARDRDRWIERNAFYYEDDLRYMRFLVPAGLRVLDLGCGTGRLLAGLNPSYGVGIDFSPAMIDVARENHPGLKFVVGDAEHLESFAQ